MSSAQEAAARLLLAHIPSDVLDAAAPRVAPPAGMSPFLMGLGVVADCAAGVLCTDPETAASMGDVPYVYARTSTTASDMEAAGSARALLTSSGGGTSHAAVLARTWRTPCIVGTGFELRGGALIRADGTSIQPGQQITVCGATGTVWRGDVPQQRDAGAAALLESLDEAALELESLPGPAVYANADTAEQVETCYRLGARGVGVARTEHMFFGDDELPMLRRALWPRDADDAGRAMAVLERRLTDKTVDLMRASAGRKLVIRLLDPPVHEFADPGDVDGPRESNPMMGVRGGRLGVVRPEIYRMQVRAMVAAHRSLAVSRRAGLTVLLPFISFGSELRRLLEVIEVDPRDGIDIGAMIETPEAVFRVREIAAVADMLSVGSNDLLQFCLAMSRDDVASALIPAYVEGGLVPADPMAHLDHSVSVMALLGQMAQAARGTPWGLCGEHAADPSSLRAVLPLGPAYVSVSAVGVLRARLEVARHRAKMLRPSSAAG